MESTSNQSNSKYDLLSMIYMINELRTRIHISGLMKLYQILFYFLQSRISVVCIFTNCFFIGLQM